MSHPDRRPRVLLTLTATGAAVALLAACGGSGSSSGAGSSSAASSGAATTLTVYSAQHENLTKEWVDGFTQATGTKVEVRYGKDASMANQIVAEGANSPADVFLTENSPGMTRVAAAGLFAPVDDATLSGVPAALTPSGRQWAPIAARATVLVYNPSTLSADALPTSLMDLQQPRWKGRWGAAAGGADFQAIVSAVLATKGEQATATWLKGLKDNAKIYQSNSATMKAVNAGEVPLGVIYHYYWYRDQALTKAGSANTRLQYLKNGDPGAFVSVSGAGVLKSSDAGEAAQQFVAYVAGKDGQTVLANSDAMEYAVGNGVGSSDALPPLDTLGAPRIDPGTLNGPKVVELMTDAGIL